MRIRHQAGTPPTTGTVARALVVALLAGGIVGAVTTASGCGDSNRGSNGNTSSTRTPRGPVPASLGDVESGAEDTIDFARQHERSRVVATARELRRAADRRATEDLRRAGVPAGRIAALADRARLVAAIAPHAKLLRVSLAANQVSALMPELYARYADPVPPDVLKLDYLDREAQLRSLAGDTAAVTAAVDELSSTWTRLRPKVIDADGRRVAATFGRHVAAMRRLVSGSDNAALRREAVTGLELVDRLEEVFRRE